VVFEVLEAFEVFEPESIRAEEPVSAEVTDTDNCSASMPYQFDK
jgi:hypothetical protein